MLDEKDWRILDELKKDSRQSTADIARKTRIPRVTVHDRIGKMKASGAISRFTVKLDEAKTGRPTVGFVLVRSLPNQQADQQKVAQDLAKHPDVVEAYRMAGDWDFLVKVRAASIEDVGDIVLKGIREVRGVERTFILTVFKELKSE